MEVLDQSNMLTVIMKMYLSQGTKLISRKFQFQYYYGFPDSYNEGENEAITNHSNSFV